MRYNLFVLVPNKPSASALNKNVELSVRLKVSEEQLKLLRAENERLKAVDQEIQRLKVELQQKTERTVLLEEEIKWLKAQYYGRSTQKTDAAEENPDQTLLFNEAQVLARIQCPGVVQLLCDPQLVNQTGLVTRFVPGPTLAQAPPQPPKPGPEHEWMGCLVGHSTGEADVKASPFGPAGKFTYTEDVDKTQVAWLPSGFFQVMHWESKGPEGEARGLTVFAYNAEEKVYYSFNFDSYGGAGVLRGTVEGDTLTLNSREFKRDSKIMKRRYVATRLSLASFSFKQEYSTEGGPWVTYTEGKATKTK